MSDFDHRNNTFDYAPQDSSGSTLGALLFVLGIVGVILVAMFFLGGDGNSTAPADPGTAPAIAPAPDVTPGAPAAPAIVE
ncbi:hypothetical protein E2K80_05450 [Rhodophyticola sp. CCM32]|uniref:hypothetical protein n=1 Tax=Rhodophyticola sp. CCM32 TaxID=2916397 RepID=UPI00107F196F|nr:hypothetical protein [Rhodophyticola sp. CCM32]QBY00249.1 hypothetical protein E2K80_05450 [Rhodophyticola sp. CCM32]